LPAAAIARANEQVAADTKSLSVAVGKDLPVEIDWASFIHHPSFTSNASYVAFIDKLALVPRKVIASTDNYWGSASLVEVASEGSMKHALNVFSKVIIRFDPTDQTDEKYGVSRTLLPRGVQSSKEGASLVITLNLNKPLACGGGRKVQHLLAPGEFAAAEQRIIHQVGKFLTSIIITTIMAV
jgi:hypothetical protein